MKTLKLISITGFVLYLFCFFLGVIPQNDGGLTTHTAVIIANLTFFIFTIFHLIFACIQGKNNSFLRITSVVCCVLFCLGLLISILTLTGAIEGDVEGWTKQATLLGYIIIFFPFAYVFSIITLVISSKALKKMKQTEITCNE
ncbi:MAG: hypothetical protein FWD24_02810 [Treponema sp.]|nr:hypothetical protein [Treponema sp.]